MSWFRALGVSALAAALVVSGCRQNPQLAKQEHLQRGRQYAAGKKYYEATVEYRIALNLDHRYGEAEVALADAYEQLGDFAHSADALARAADLRPDDLDVQLRAGSHRLLAGGYDDARGLAERVLVKQPSNIAALLLRANALAGMSDLTAAAKQIEEAIALEPDRAELYTNLASIRSASGHREEAETAYKKAIAISPDSPLAHAGLARFYWQSNRLQEAEQSFLKAVTLDPSYAIGNRILGTFYIATGRPAQAERFIKAVADLVKDVESSLRLADYYLLYGKSQEGVKVLAELAKRPEGAARATIRLAAQAYASGSTNKAHRMLEALIEKDPGDALALQLRSHFLFLEGKFSDASAVAQKAIQAEPGLDSAHYILARLHVARGMIREAIAELKQVVQLNPYAAPAQMLLAQLQADAGYYDQAVTLANAAAKTAGGAPEMRVALIRVLFAKGDLPRAESELASLRKQHPKEPQVLAAQGDLHLLKKEFASARAAFDQALAVDPSSLDGLKGRVAVDLFTGNPAAVRTRLDNELAKTPDRTGVLLLAARMYGALRDLPRAEDTLKKAIATNPASLEAYRMLGQLYYEQGRLDESRREFEKIVGRQPRNTTGLTMLGIIAREQGQTDDAIRHYEDVLAIDPEARVAANNLAWIYAERKQQLDRAVDLATRVFRRLPNDPNVADTLAWVFLQRENAAAALPHLLRIVEQQPQEPEFRYHLGVAYAQLKETDKARAELEQALRLSRTFSGAADAQRLLDTLK